MRRVILSPLVERPWYSEEIEAHVLSYFKETIFDALVDLVAEFGQTIEEPGKDHKRRLNTRAGGGCGALKRGLETGAVWYASGVFTGSFNAEISKELRDMGAKKRESVGGFAMRQEETPYEIRTAIASSLARSEKMHADIISTLGSMADNIKSAPSGLYVKESIDTIVYDIHKQFVDVAYTKHNIDVPVAASAFVLAAILNDTTSNLDQSTKAFAEGEIEVLREEVQGNLVDGMRPNRLARIIEARFGIAKRKAAAVARNEASRILGEYVQNGAQSIGSDTYVWDTCRDERVRPDHQVLHGKVFSWSSPPVVNSSTGEQGHPGEPINCRCGARICLTLPSD